MADNSKKKPNNAELIRQELRSSSNPFDKMVEILDSLGYEPKGKQK